ncbi:hypothetical protein [Hymenobacter sp. GOD-10R]|uniref:hypothetical protein n=1 Tax=Hymenobacter sp. GOD-10R TaxID=3093922 RepID=UPI002D76517A|nr:hypothetical protein [Hymenobacter sp. GOD-10R]WRQ32010.1 hypothetical protein SD425_29840 [Hymenobacter sp. GOD-10R]
MELGTKEYKRSGEYNELVSLIELAEKAAEGVNSLESTFAKIRTRVLILLIVIYSLFAISAYIIIKYLKSDVNQLYEIIVILFALTVTALIFSTLVKDFNELKKGKAQLRVEKAILYSLLELTDSVKRKVFSEESRISFIDKALLQMRLKRISFNVDYKNNDEIESITRDIFSLK